MSIILQYVCAVVPVVFAFICELSLVKIAIKVFKEIQNGDLVKQVLKQNETLVAELREQRKQVKELLTSIDKIKRGE